jgi:hypothetical protein
MPPAQWINPDTGAAVAAMPIWTEKQATLRTESPLAPAVARPAGRADRVAEELSAGPEDLAYANPVVRGGGSIRYRMAISARGEGRANARCHPVPGIGAATAESIFQEIALIPIVGCRKGRRLSTGYLFSPSEGPPATMSGDPANSRPAVREPRKATH